VTRSTRILFNARRGHQDIDAAKGGQSRFGHFVHLGFLGDINGDKLCLAPQRLHTRQRFRSPGRLGREVGNNAVGTLFGKAYCRRLANARCPPRNDRHTLL
jgi:hypothetical protein